MNPKRGWLMVVAGAILLLFGLGCLNYTKADGLEHHQKQAVRYNLPAPGPAIFRIGVVATVVGAGLLGFGIGAKRNVS
jgi:dipeptide/tripeptide permease